MTKDHKAHVILRLVCSFYEYEPETVLSPSRKAEVVRVRFTAMALCRRYTRCSLAEVGEMFHRDHKTVMWAEKWVRDRTSYDRIYATEILTLVLAVERILTPQGASNTETKTK